MTSSVIEIDGLHFGIHAEDWRDADAAEAAADVAAARLRTLTADDRAALHADLAAYVRGELDDYPILAQEIGLIALRDVTKNWSRAPDTGHSVYITAEA